jgi:hypothetical protein
LRPGARVAARHQLAEPALRAGISRRKVEQAAIQLLGVRRLTPLLAALCRPVQELPRRVALARRELARAAQRLRGQTLVEQQGDQRQRRLQEVGIARLHLHQRAGGPRAVAGGQQAGGRVHRLAAFEEELGGAGVVAGLRAALRPPQRLARGGKAASGIAIASCLLVGVSRPCLLLGGLPARACLRPIATRLVGLRGLARQAGGGEDVGRLERAAEAEVDASHQAAVEVAILAQQPRGALAVADLEAGLDGFGDLPRFLEQVHRRRRWLHALQHLGCLGGPVEPAQELGAAHLHRSQTPGDLLAGAAAAVAAQPLRLDLEHPQGGVELAGLVVAGRRVRVELGPLVEMSGARPAVQLLGGFRGLAVGPGELEQAERQAVMAVSGKQLRGLQGAGAAEVVGDAAQAGAERALDGSPLVADLDGRSGRLVEGPRLLVQTRRLVLLARGQVSVRLPQRPLRQVTLQHAQPSHSRRKPFTSCKFL